MLKEPRAFIFVGRSGCGKGTQAQLLRQHLNKIDSTRPTLYFESGSRFREFSQGSEFAARQVKTVLEKGGLLPSFLAIWNWSRELIAQADGNQHWILDGVSRTLAEAQAIGEACRFFNFPTTFIVCLDVSPEWATARLTARGRSDDLASAKIEERQNWFKTQVLPALDFYRQDPYYQFLNINGEQTIEEVHGEILMKLNL